VSAVPKNRVRALIYARYSTDRQSCDSTADQIRRCRKYANHMGWSVGQSFTDEGISGAALGNRPGLQDVLATVQPGDVLLVVDTTRLSRSQDLAPLLTRLRHQQVHVIGVLDGFDSESSTARMQAGLSRIMSEEFRAQIAARTHSALHMRAQQDRPTGGRAYGYDNNGVVIEAEAAIVREIFARAADGEAQRSIAADLNTRGVPFAGASCRRKPGRARGQWLVSAIHSILENERYRGRWVWNRSVWRRDPDSGKRQRVVRPKSEWIVREGPAIVDKDTWDRVQALSKPRKFHGGPGGGTKYLLSGVLVCGECGGKLIASGKGGRYYYCGNNRAGGSAACSVSIGTRRDVAEELLLAPIERALLSPAAVELATALITKWSKQERVAAIASADVNEIDERIAKIEAQIEAGILDRQDLAPSIAALQERRKAVLEASWRKASTKVKLDPRAAAAAYRAAASRMRETLSGPIDQARAAIHEFLGDVVCRPGDGHLIADVQLNPVPLYRAAGVTWIGSGGLLPIQAIPLDRTKTYLDSAT